MLIYSYPVIAAQGRISAHSRRIHMGSAFSLMDSATKAPPIPGITRPGRAAPAPSMMGCKCFRCKAPLTLGITRWTREAGHRAGGLQGLSVSPDATRFNDEGFGINSIRSCFRNSVSHESDCVPPLIRGGQEGFAAVAFVYSHFYRRQPPLIPLNPSPTLPLSGKGENSGGKLVPETFQAEISLIFKTALRKAA
jgi:hypothetical protein